MQEHIDFSLVTSHIQLVQPTPVRLYVRCWRLSGSTHVGDTPRLFLEEIRTGFGRLASNTMQLGCWVQVARKYVQSCSLDARQTGCKLTRSYMIVHGWVSLLQMCVTRRPPLLPPGNELSHPTLTPTPDACLVSVPGMTPSHCCAPYPTFHHKQFPR